MWVGGGGGGEYHREGNSKVKDPEVRACPECSRKGKEGNAVGMHEAENSRR